jgi:F-type H+-transporting ATPase subunit beta
VTLDDALRGCEAILRGDADEWNEASLYMIGRIEDAEAKQKSTRAGGEQ